MAKTVQWVPMPRAGSSTGTITLRRPRQDAGLERVSMIHIALWEPEIPPNTGNIARLCAATGACLHLIGRLGFHLDERSLRRAGLDYWDCVELHRYASWSEFEKAWLERGHSLERIFCFSAKATRPF